MAAADPGKAVLQAIDMLTNQAQEAEEHAERCQRLEKVLDPELTENMVTCASASYSHAAATSIMRFGSTQPLNKPRSRIPLSQRTKARKKSKELQEQIATLMDGSLEAAFKQFDTDGSGTLDNEELKAAYSAAGQEVDEMKLMKMVKMLDTNGDGVACCAGVSNPAPPQGDILSCSNCCICLCLHPLVFSQI